MITVTITREGWAHDNAPLHALGITGQDAAYFKGLDRTFATIDEADDFLYKAAFEFYEGDEGLILKHYVKNRLVHLDTTTARIIT